MPKNVPGRADHAASVDRNSLVARIRKLVVYICGAAGMLVTAGVFDDRTEAIVMGLLAAATGAGIYKARNAPAAVAPPDPNLRAGR